MNIARNMMYMRKSVFVLFFVLAVCFSVLSISVLSDFSKFFVKGGSVDSAYLILCMAVMFLIYVCNWSYKNHPSTWGHEGKLLSHEYYYLEVKDELRNSLRCVRRTIIGEMVVLTVGYVEPESEDNVYKLAVYSDKFRDLLPLDHSVMQRFHKLFVREGKGKISENPYHGGMIFYRNEISMDYYHDEMCKIVAHA
jgi:hypothetical protein